MSAYTVRGVVAAKVQPGDQALHLSGTLDSREVVEVSGTMIRIDILGRPSEWLPKRNYTFKRVTFTNDRQA